MKEIEEALDKLAAGFLPFLNQNEEEYLSRIAGFDAKKTQALLAYKDWDWFQGVGLYGFFMYDQFAGDETYHNILVQYYETQMKKGLPPKNINAVCPMLTLAFLYERENCPQWLAQIREWASWLIEELPKTEEGGFQHVTAEDQNEGQLWDDTLFVAVLFLAKAGQLTGRQEYIEAAKYQFLLHERYLADPKTGLWYHGFTFNGRHNYGKVFWARGNAWITLAIPTFLEILDLQDSVGDYLVRAYRNQVKMLKKIQDISGLWHTVLDDMESYLEASASAGIAAGILKGIEMGILSEEYRQIGMKTADALRDLIDSKGFLHQVSIGTPLGPNKEFYRKIPMAPMGYGQALGILYFIQVKKANIKESFEKMG